MPFKIGDEVVLVTNRPFYGIGGTRRVLSEVGIVIEENTKHPWVVDFPSHGGFYAETSDLALATDAKPLGYTKATKHSNACHVKASKPPEPSLNTREVMKQWELDMSLHLETLAADFYTLLNLSLDLPEEPLIVIPLKRVTNLLATQFSAYLDMVIGGELRHAQGNVSSGEENRYGDPLNYDCVSDMPLSVTAKEILEAFSSFSDMEGRNYVWKEWQGIRKKLGMDALKAAKEIFNLDWESGYGGESWANATKVLMDYLNGELSAVGFVDTCFGLHHNNNIILDKVWRIQLELNDVLNYNLDNRMDDVAMYCSPEVVKLVRRFSK